MYTPVHHGNNTVGFQEYGSGTETINGVEWSWIDYRHIAQGIESRVRGYRAVRHGRAYAVLCGGAPERVNDLKADFDKVVGSLRTP